MQERQGLQIILHASAFFAPFLVPVIMYLVGSFVTNDMILKRQSIQALLFQLFIGAGFAISAVLMYVLIGFLLMPIFGLMWLFVPIIAIVRTVRGETYYYPVVKYIV